MRKYLDKNGLLYLWSKIKGMFDKKVDKEEGKTLTSNDFTDDLKRKLEGIDPSASDYVLPVADETTLGGVKKGDNVNIADDGKISVSVMRGANGTAAGVSGLVPVPAGADNVKYLRGDGTWASPDNTEYNEASESVAGLMSADDKKKLNSIDENANDYELPAATTSELGGVKSGNDITVDGTGVVTVDHAATASTAESIAWSGVTSKPDQFDPDMTGANGSTAGEHGLVPAPSASDNVKFLRGDGSWATPPGKEYNNASQSEPGLMSPDDKTKLDAFGPASDYALKSDIADVYTVKGSVADYSDLPTNNAKKGDVYNVQATGMNYVWTGAEWDALGSVFTIDPIENTEIDELVGS